MMVKELFWTVRETRSGNEGGKCVLSSSERALADASS